MFSLFDEHAFRLTRAAAVALALPAIQASAHSNDETKKIAEDAYVTFGCRLLCPSLRSGKALPAPWVAEFVLPGRIFTSGHSFFTGSGNFFAIVCPPILRSPTRVYGNEQRGAQP